MGLIFVGGGDGSFQVFWWTDLEVDLERTQNCCMHGVMGPISIPNDYLNTVFDDAVSLHGSCKTMPSHGSTGKVSTCCQFTEYTCFTFDGRGWVIYRIKKNY